MVLFNGHLEISLVGKEDSQTLTLHLKTKMDNLLQGQTAMLPQLVRIVKEIRLSLVM